MQKSIISVYYDYNINGPGRVVHNLSQGLKTIGYNVLHNPPIPQGYIGLLQPHRIWQKLDGNENVVCGPNLFVLPSENASLCKKFKMFVCPSNWVYDKYRQFSELDHAELHVWSVGIDTENWCSKRFPGSIKKNVILYVKNREDLKYQVKYQLSKFDINLIVIEYGNYSEDQLRNLCSQSDACVLLTGTESQGIAYMQILSCGIPCYVIDKNMWNYDGRFHEVTATSVPYFNESCGVKVSEFEDHSFNKFLVELDRFDSRSFILNDHTLVASAKKYVRILESSRQ